MSMSLPFISLYVQMLGTNDKAMVACGEVPLTEWLQARRQLGNVSEASLLHMSKESIQNRLTALYSAAAASAPVGGIPVVFPALKTLRIVHNDFVAVRNVSLNGRIDVYTNLHFFSWISFTKCSQQRWNT